eukprot:gene13100-8517_t
MEILNYFSEFFSIFEDEEKPKIKSKNSKSKSIDLEIPKSEYITELKEKVSNKFKDPDTRKAFYIEDGESKKEKYAQNILKRNYYDVYHIGGYVQNHFKDIIIFQNQVVPGKGDKFRNIELTYILPRPGYSKIYMDLVSLSNDENVFKKLGLKLSDRFSEEAQKKYSKIFGEKLDYKSYGSLTNINIFGISFVIKCEKKLFLFTADFHSRDTVEGLDKYFKDI